MAIAYPFLSGCTSMKTVDMPESELQSRIRAGELVEVGEKVQLVTSDGREPEFVVTGIDDNAIYGDGEQIPIDDVVAIKTRRFSAGKTAALAGGAVGAWALIAILVAPALILAAAAP